MIRYIYHKKVWSIIILIMINSIHFSVAINVVLELFLNLFLIYNIKNYTTVLAIRFKNVDKIKCKNIILNIYLYYSFQFIH